MGFLIKLLTKNDNVTFDEIKVGGFLILTATSLALIVSSFICAWLVLQRDGAFDANAYLNGLAAVVTATAAVLGAMGVGIGFRDKLSGG